MGVKVQFNELKENLILTMFKVLISVCKNNVWDNWCNLPIVLCGIVLVGMINE
jgi:hypothetical protein